MKNILTSLFSGDEQSKQIVSEFLQCSLDEYNHPDDPRYDKAAYRATDLFIENDLYDFSCYHNEAQGIEETGLPED